MRITQPLVRIAGPMAIATTIAALGLAVGCSDSSTGVNGTSTGANQIAFMTSAAATGDAAAFDAVSAPIVAGKDTIILSTVAVTIARAEFKARDNDECDGDHDEDSVPPATTPPQTPGACGEFKAGPFTVNLPLSGGLVTVPAGTLPTGTFNELELNVSKVEVVGTFDGKAFDDTLNVSAHVELAFTTPITVGDTGTVSVTVNVPVNTWFVNSNGTLVNMTALTNSGQGSALSDLRNRIAASFRAFRDNDHDGRDDHGEGHGG